MGNKKTETGPSRNPLRVVIGELNRHRAIGDVQIEPGEATILKFPIPVGKIRMSLVHDEIAGADVLCLLLGPWK